MIRMACSICGPQIPSSILYKANFNLDNFTIATFGARRIPDGVHYQVHRCHQCNLLFSNPILEPDQIENLYRDSLFTYDEEIENLKKTYGFYLKKMMPRLANTDSLLEVGCGSGFFLEKALELGFKNVYGIEPSLNALEKASPIIKNHIYTGLLKEGIYPQKSFDVICAFQLFDHLLNPNTFLNLCSHYLKDTGYLFMIHHNAGFWLTKLLKSKSPIIDIQHIYLFDKRTQKNILEKNKFKAVKMFDIYNSYSMKYWIKLFPMPLSFKTLLIQMLQKSGFHSKVLKLSVGNMGMIAQKK